MLIHQLKNKMLNLGGGNKYREMINYFFNSIKKAIISKNYSTGTENIFLVFDLDRFNSLKRLFNWVERWKKEGVWGNPNVKFFLVGTK